MADNHDTLDFFGRLENRLALVATMTEAQGQRLDRLSPVEPVAGELCNEISALRVDVAAAVDELRKLARHVMAVEALTLPAAALAQQMQADAQTRANVAADRRTWPATWADGLAATPVPVAVFRPELDEQRMEVARQLLELRRQGRLVDAQELAGSDLLDMAELQAQALANLANAPALVSLDVLDEISARGQAMLGRLRQLVDTDARAAQTPVYSVLGPLGLIR